MSKANANTSLTEAPPTVKSTPQPVVEALAPSDNTVTLSVDGTSVTVDKGTNIIEAARQVGKKISSFCYHPGLDIVAVCRQCLVTVEGSPKLVPACQGTVTEGMVVHTKDEASSDARRQLLEFTLLNHPVDCPICDKAGECTLQELYFDHNGQMSRLDVPKVRKPKVVDLGPTVVLDAERCILCTRCIRVCDDVAGKHQLEISQRGDHSELGAAPGQQLDNPYSLNTVDVCPVGALTAKDFRFSMRAWELMATPSVCNGCATGCNIEIHHRGGKTYRIIPRHNEEVNGHWMCDDGRFSYHSLTEGRLVGPVMNGMPSSWPRSLASAAERITAVLASDPGAMGIVFSPHRTNEENYALAKIASETWNIDRRYHGGLADDPSRADDILRKADISPNRRGVHEIAGECQTIEELEHDLASGTLRGLVVLGHELPLSDIALDQAAALECLLVLCDHEEGIAQRAQIALPLVAWAENTGSVTNHTGRVQRMQAAYSALGQAWPGWQIIDELATVFGTTMNYSSAKQVFSEMKTDIPAFSDSEWGQDLPPVQLRFANSRG